MLLFNKLLNSKPLLWVLLALPAMPFLQDFFDPQLYSAEMMYDTGLISTQLLVLTLGITPLVQLLKKTSNSRELNRWLLQRRRNFGVASFLYALLHVLLYLRDNNEWQIVWSEALSVEYGSGWLAFFVMLALALTSNDTAMRMLGRHWKVLQRWAYFVAGATFLHWLSFGFFIMPGLQWLAILVALKALQTWYKLERHF